MYVTSLILFMQTNTLSSSCTQSNFLKTLFRHRPPDAAIGVRHFVSKFTYFRQIVVAFLIHPFHPPITMLTIKAEAFGILRAGRISGLGDCEKYRRLLHPGSTL